MKSIESIDNGEHLDAVISALNYFCDREKISNEQLKAEYLLAKNMYTTARPENPPALEDMNLQDLLAAGIEAGLDDYTFETILNVRSKYENAVSNFNQMVDGLNTSEDEKKILKSIIENGTKGSIVARRGGSTLFVTEVFRLGEEKEDQALELIQDFSEYPGGEEIKIEFTPD